MSSPATILPDFCPDCGQALNQPAEPCGYLGKLPVWCATCEGCHAPRDPSPNGQTADGDPITSTYP